MNIAEIKTYLENPDPQKRLQALTELRSPDYDAETVVPLLKNLINDKEFLVRSFVAMGLGKKQNAESFAALLELIKFDRDPNVRAEATNSLSLFGEIAAPHLVATFDRDDHWLVRRSILAAMMELDCPTELLEISTIGIVGEDLTVAESSVDCLASLAGKAQQNNALEKILSMLQAEWWGIRWRVAKALARFDDPQAKEALMQLKQDEDHRVVGAALDGLI